MTVEERIKKLRLCILVHSRLYYEDNTNIISDKQWDTWARELVDLQARYPEVSKSVIWYDAFADWDASTGAFLPLNDPWVISKAQYVASLFRKPISSVSNQKTKKQKPSASMRLF